jgi:hypothetical protein
MELTGGRDDKRPLRTGPALSRLNGVRKSKDVRGPKRVEIEFDQKAGVWEDDIRVPLMIRGPGVPANS